MLEDENLIWKYINELPNRLLNYVLTEVTQEWTCHRAYNSNIITSDNMCIDVLDTSVVSQSPKKYSEKILLEHWQVPSEVLSQVDK